MFALFLRWLSGRSKPSDEKMMADCFGWCSEAMTPHYERVVGVWHGTPVRPGDHLYHVLKNCLTEWIELDPRRAMKAFTALFALMLIWILLRELLPLLRRYWARRRQSGHATPRQP